MTKKSRPPRPEVSTSDALLQTAQQYLIAIRDLREHDPFGHVLQPFYLLVCFCLEISMKAVIKAAGATENDLADVGHDLGEAFAKAIDCGLSGEGTVPWEIPMIVDQMQRFHKEHWFRYTPQFDTETIPHPDLIIRALNAHVNECAWLERFPRKPRS